MLFNRHCTHVSSSVWQIKLTDEDVKAIESDGYSLRSNMAVYWPMSAHSGAKLIVLKSRWEDVSYLL